MHRPVGVLWIVGCLGACGLGACGSSSHGHPADAPPSDTAVVLDEPSPMLLSSSQARVTGGQVATELAFSNPSVGPVGMYQTEHTGTCYVSDCLHPIPTAWPGITAGQLTATNSAMTITDDANANGYYATQSIVGATGAWTPGDIVKIAGAGGQVPAFSQMLTFPTALGLSSPPTALDHTQPLVLQWTGGVGTVLAVISFDSGTAADYDELRVVCELDGPSGTGTIPANLTSRFTAGQAVTLTVGNADVQHVTAGTAHLYVYAANGARVMLNVQ